MEENVTKEVINEGVKFSSKHPKIARGIAITIGAILTGGIVAAVYFISKGIKNRKAAKNATSGDDNFDEFEDE